MNYDERTLAAYLTDMMDGKVAAEATARAAGLTAEETARVAGLAEKAEIVTGYYIGDDASTRTIDLGFSPRALLIMTEMGQLISGGCIYGGLAFPDHPVQSNYKIKIEILSNGFRVGQALAEYTATNQNNYTYHYLAVR